jgi:ABC-type transport system involved in multi-copper enzyme maturation permease subunit
MTAGTVTPYQPGQQTRRDGFAQLLRAEWTKFRTVRGWVVGTVVAVLVIVGIGLFAAGGNGSSCQSTGGGPARSGAACMPIYPVGPGGEAVTDSFYFVRQPLTGNGSITVQVTSLTGLLPPANGNLPSNPAAPVDTRPGLVPWAKAGLIIKDGTGEGSAYAAMMVTADHGVRMQDNYTNDTAGQPGAVSPASPRWLRLTRSGDTITGYDSADGTHWTQVGAVHLAGLPSTVQAGLFAASPAYAVISESFGGGETGSISPSQATAVFDHVSRSGTWPSGAWTGDYIGAADGSGIGGYHQADGRFTVTGSGDIAPVAAGQGGAGVTIAVHLVGTFAGLIAVIVIATMFITAEYRRGLIRTTLTASPRRGRVLAAKAIVIGSVAFVAGLAAAAATLIFGARIARARGSYVFPVSWPTELRVVVGTAALIAVGAVLALALGTVLRRSAAAVALVIVVIVLPYILGVASILPVSASDWLLRITPAAAFAIQQATPQYPQVTAVYSPSSGYFPLAPWAGFAVMCAYAALALGLAVVLLRRRDA